MPVIDRTGSVLTSELLERCAARAAGYDQENRFFQEDFEELNSRRLPAHGGAARVRRRGSQPGAGLPRAAPPGVPRAGHRAGDEHAPVLDGHRGGPVPRRATARSSGCWRRRADGEVFAAGHGEPATTCPCCCPTAKAERVDGGYDSPATRCSASLTPGVDAARHPRDGQSDPENPKVVHAFMPRDTAGYRDQGDVGHARHARHAQRRHDPATARSSPTVHRAGGARRFRRRGPVRARRSSPGRSRRSAASTSRMAQRAPRPRRRERQKKTSVALGGRRWPTTPRSSTPSPRWIWSSTRSRARRARSPTTGRTASTTAALGRRSWCRRSTTPSRRPSAWSISRWRSAAARGCSRRNELERLYRDVRCGGFHPANASSSHEIVGKTALGVLAESVRW